MRLFFVLLISLAYSSRLKKDGTPDYRYSENRIKGYNIDGSSDKRYSANRNKGYNMDGSIDKRYSNNEYSSYNTKKLVPPDQTSNKIVYGCTNKKTTTLDYIGVTNDFNRRMQEHRNDGKIYANTNTHLCEIINDNIMSYEQAYQQEKQLIALCKFLGQCDYNLNIGGGGPR